jgi:hypothetical protein
VILVCLFLFIKIILVICGFSKDIRVVYASLLFMRFWLFVGKCLSTKGMSGHESARSLKGMCEGC